MDKIKLSENLLLTAMRLYANNKDLQRDPKLYTDRVIDMLTNGAGARFTDDEFYKMLERTTNTPSEFTIDKSSLDNERRPKIFYKRN